MSGTIEDTPSSKEQHLQKWLKELDKNYSGRNSCCNMGFQCNNCKNMSIKILKQSNEKESSKEIITYKVDEICCTDICDDDPVRIFKKIIAHNGTGRKSELLQALKECMVSHLMNETTDSHTSSSDAQKTHHWNTFRDNKLETYDSEKAEVTYRKEVAYSATDSNTCDTLTLFEPYVSDKVSEHHSSQDIEQLSLGEKKTRYKYLGDIDENEKDADTEKDVTEKESALSDLPSVFGESLSPDSVISQEKDETEKESAFGDFQNMSDEFVSPESVAPEEKIDIEKESALSDLLVDELFSPYSFISKSSLFSSYGFQTEMISGLGIVENNITFMEDFSGYNNLDMLSVSLNIQPSIPFSCKIGEWGNIMYLGDPLSTLGQNMRMSVFASKCRSKQISLRSYDSLPLSMHGLNYSSEVDLSWEQPEERKLWDVMGSLQKAGAQEKGDDSPEVLNKDVLDGPFSVEVQNDCPRVTQHQLWCQKDNTKTESKERLWREENSGPEPYKILSEKSCKALCNRKKELGSISRQGKSLQNKKYPCSNKGMSRQQSWRPVFSKVEMISGSSRHTKDRNAKPDSRQLKHTGECFQMPKTMTKKKKCRQPVQGQTLRYRSYKNPAKMSYRRRRQEKIRGNMHRFGEINEDKNRYENYECIRRKRNWKFWSTCSMLPYEWNKNMGKDRRIWQRGNEVEQWRRSDKGSEWILYPRKPESFGHLLSGFWFSQDKWANGGSCPLWPLKSPPVRLAHKKLRSHSGGQGDGNGRGRSGGNSGGSSRGRQGGGGGSSHESGRSGSQDGSSGASGGGNDDGDKNRRKNNFAVDSCSFKDSPGNENKKSSKDKAIAQQQLNNNFPVPRSPAETGTEPTLPPPILDEKTKKLRNLKERPDRVNNGSENAESSREGSSGSEKWSEESKEGSEEAPCQPLQKEPGQTSRSGDDDPSDVVPNHAALSMPDLCDILGHATSSSPASVRTVDFENLNLCLSRLMHDLSNAGVSLDDEVDPCILDCHCCLVLSLLVTHTANLDHDGFGDSCNQCRQVFNLMTQHAVVCIENKRDQKRLSRFDICYKICKSANWDSAKLGDTDERLQGKIRKYSAKVLGTLTRSVPDMAEDPEVGISETEGTISEIPSVSSQHGLSLSLNGNIVTYETVGQDEEQEEVPPQAPEPPVQPSVVPHSAAAMPSSGGSGLYRRSSGRRQAAIPPRIVEENKNAESEFDVEAILHKHFGNKRDDPNDTQRTYGETNRVASLPTWNVHEPEQFMSFVNHPTGVPGIGEVVIGRRSVLIKTAMFWEKKREECERTGYCPYQHREEGVILADQKENFSVLRTRYQKHHQWDKVTHLGNGMSGKCHLAIDLKTNFKFCCKKIHLLKYTAEELTLWLELLNPNVVRLYGAIRHGVKIYIFSEFIDGGSLAACIEEQKLLGRRLSHWSAVNYFQQLLNVLIFLQSKHILHEDIKADNILLRRDTTYLAVTDFGTSHRLQDPKELKNKSPVGSQAHWSPEKAAMEGHGYPADLWAAVCVLVHMLSGDPPWVKRFQKKAALLNFVIYIRPPPMEDVPDSVQSVVRDLIETGFVKDPQQRPTASQLLSHPAFNMLVQSSTVNFYSTLMSQAHSTRPPHLSQEGVRRTQNVGDVVVDEAGEEPPSTLLFHKEVTTGPVQESDSRAGDKESAIQATEIDTNETSGTADTVEDDQKTVVHSEHAQVPETEASKSSPDTDLAEENTETEETTQAAADSKSEQEIQGKKSRVNELVGPRDINELLPHFELIFSSGSSSDQSIKSFFADACNSTIELGRQDAQRPALQEYKPEERRGEILPNLSIFGHMLPESSAEYGTQEPTEIPLQAHAKNELMEQSLEYINKLTNSDKVNGQTEATLRSSVFGRRPPNNPVNFHLSSGSDDCTSAELFGSDSSLTAVTTTQTITIRAPFSLDRTLDDPLPSEPGTVQSSRLGSEESFPSNQSPTASAHSPTGFTKRKQTNLKIDVKCQNHSSTMTSSKAGAQLTSATSAPTIGAADDKVKRHPEYHLSSSFSYHPHSGISTPITGLSSSSKKHHPTSGSTASSSVSNPFKYSSSVQEEQDKMMRELQDDMLEALSHSGSGNESQTDPWIREDIMEPKGSDATSTADDMSDVYTRMEMLGAIDPTPLGGCIITFYLNEKISEKNTFTVRWEESWPWRDLLPIVERKMSKLGYRHFTILKLNNSKVSRHSRVSNREYKIIEEEANGADCQCSNCGF